MADLDGSRAVCRKGLNRSMNCDRIARWYRWLEYAAFGRALEQRRGAFLREITGARRILALGDGDGRGLARLVRAAPAARIDYVDRSLRMLELAHRLANEGTANEVPRTKCRPQNEHRIAFHHADALTFAFPGEAYDAIVTHFFLDCFDEKGLDCLTARVAKAAAPQARWIVSEFRRSSPWSAALIHLLYLFFGITTGLKTRRLADHRPVLQHHGWRRVRTESSLHGLLVSELWERVIAGPGMYSSGKTSGLVTS
jgi:SAM-dependent methyltransferase